MTAALTGYLSEDAPGLWQKLARVLGNSQREEIAELYRTLYAHALVQEPELPRPAGVSFAPRPTRLVTLLLQHMPDPDLELVLAAMATGANALPRFEFPFSRTTTLTQQAWDKELRNAAPEAKVLAGMRILDDVRHLHQQNPSQQVQTRASLYERYLQIRDSLPAEKLRTLIEAAFERYDRFGAQE